MPPPLHGILNLDKPAGLSSAAAVAKIKWLLPRGTKVGHAGTLDPFATGVLLVLVGRATKQCESLMNQPKSYQALLKLGATTDTDDVTSPEHPTAIDRPRPSLAEIESILPEFVGSIVQLPPAFSALKVGGKRAYQLARKGTAPALSPRTVNVYGLRVAAFDWPALRIEIDCGRGFYVRALARDIGRRLGVGGHLTELRRTAVGAYPVETATPLHTLTAENLPSAIAAPDALPVR